MREADKSGRGGVTMLVYSLLLTVAVVVGAPWWAMRLLTTERYREGLGERLGRVPGALLKFVTGKRVVWVHAVSVGEVLAATRLVGELEVALGRLGGESPAGWGVVVSTTTRTGQALARERFGAGRVFYYPLDFGWVVRRYLRALRPAAVVLMESEVWPRMVWECGRAGVAVVVVNARVSDRSLARGMRVRWVWGRVLRGVGLWLAQSEEDGRRLVALGATVEAVTVAGNLKYDVRAPRASRVAELIKEAAAGRPIIVAGSTGQDHDGYHGESSAAINAWLGTSAGERTPLLILAPRHPEKFDQTEGMASVYSCIRASQWKDAEGKATSDDRRRAERLEIVVLDTIGDLAAVYGVADVAFVGGSLVRRGGHNPLEPAQFGVPVVMGPSFENFRDIVGKMIDAGGIRIVKDELELEVAFQELLTDREGARAMGERGRRVFEEQQGATGRAVEAIVGLVTK